VAIRVAQQVEITLVRICTPSHKAKHTRVRHPAAGDASLMASRWVAKAIDGLICDKPLAGSPRSVGPSDGLQ
jgi:hypothetical protein